MFGVRPKMRVEPIEPVSSSAAQREAQNALGRIENSELTYKLFRFTTSFVWLQKRTARDQWASNDGDKLNDRLMWHANGIRVDTLTKQIGRNALLFGKARVVPIHQDVRINQRRHGRIDRIASILDPCAPTQRAIEGQESLADLAVVWLPYRSISAGLRARYWISFVCAGGRL